MPRAAEFSLLASTGWRMFREDPAWLAVQAARRVAPRRRRSLAPGEDQRGLAAALGAFIADRPGVAADLLRERGVSGRRPGDGVAARVAVQVGAPDALAPRVAARPEVAAALAEQRGDLSGAVRLLAGRRGAAARKVRAEQAMLTPGFRLPVPDVAWDGPGAGVRVLHVLTNSLPHTRSGYAQRTQRLLAASQGAGVTLEAATRIGYPTTVGVLGARESDVVGGVRYHRLLTGRLARDPRERLSQQVDALIPLARSFRPSALHTTTDYTNALVTQALADALGVPWVYEMRGQLELTWVAARAQAYRDAAAGSERVRLLRAKEAELAASADAVVVLSQVQADDLVARGVPAEQRIHVVPNGIDEAWLEGDVSPADARGRLGLPRGGVWLGTVTSMVDYEGLETLLDAVAALRAEGLDVRACLVGDGVSRPRLMAHADALGLGESALFPGRVPGEQARGWYEALDVFVVPRRDTPVCRMVTPLKPIEAMALGRPVVASDLPALRDVVADGAAGILFAADDAGALAEALGPLVRSEARRTEVGRAGRVRASERTWVRGAQTLMDVYRERRG